MILSILVNWFVALGVSRAESRSARAKALLAVAVTANVLILFVAKYLTFVLGVIDRVGGGRLRRPLHSAAHRDFVLHFPGYVVRHRCLSWRTGPTKRFERRLLHLLFPAACCRGPLCATPPLPTRSKTGKRAGGSFLRAYNASSLGLARRCFSPIPAVSLPIGRLRVWETHRRCFSGSVSSRTPCRFTTISRATRTCPLAWGGCSGSNSPRTSIIPMSRNPYPNSGAGGTSRWGRGFGTTCIFLWAGAEWLPGAVWCSTCLSCGR